MKKSLLITLATLVLVATPAFAGELLDSHGKPVATKDASAIAISTQTETTADAAEAKAPAKKAVMKKKKSKHKAKKAAPVAEKTEAAPATTH
jgi:hypothetical protein